MMVNYQKATNIPQDVRVFCNGFDAWLVGSAAGYILDITEAEPRDWDILVPLFRWPEAMLVVPRGQPSNSFGGIKISRDNTQIDVWGGDIGQYFANVPKHPAYAVQLRTMCVLSSAKGYVRSSKAQQTPTGWSS